MSFETYIRTSTQTACDSQGVAVEGKSSSVWVRERLKDGWGSVKLQSRSSHDPIILYAASGNSLGIIHLLWCMGSSMS